MNKSNPANETLADNMLDAERNDNEKKQKDSFEIMIRGSEIYRINSRTKEIVQVFQCVDHCLRGNKADGLYAGDFELMGHPFSVTGKESTENQYIINIFGDVMFTITVNKMIGTHIENKIISAEYEECLNEYAVSFGMEKENTETRIWIEIN